MPNTAYRIVKLSCDAPEVLITGVCCRAIRRRFPIYFESFAETEQHLKRYVKRFSAESKTVIGYLIQEIYSNDPRRVYRQWSYTSDGRFLAEANINSHIEFNGRATQTLPFQMGDYVIAYYCGGLTLGWIAANPPSPTEVEDAKQLAEIGVLSDVGPFYYRLDSSDDCYLVDFTQREHGHPSVTEVFPLPFPESAISDEVKKALRWY